VAVGSFGPALRPPGISQTKSANCGYQGMEECSDNHISEEVVFSLKIPKQIE